MNEINKNFAEFYKDNYSAVYGFIYKITLDKALSEDIIQETFIKAYAHADSFHNESKVSVWLCSIAYNSLIDYKRKKSYSMLSIDDEILQNTLADMKSDPPKDVIKQIMSECIQSKISLLPENYRIPYVLDMQGYSNQEIAHILKCTLENAKIRLHRARKKMKEILGNDCSFYHDNRNVLC